MKIYYCKYCEYYLKEHSNNTRLLYEELNYNIGKISNIDDYPLSFSSCSCCNSNYPRYKEVIDLTEYIDIFKLLYEK